MASQGRDPVSSHYCGPATISDGLAESHQDIEIHVRAGRNGISPAWHVIIKDKLPRDLRSPQGKALSVCVAGGGSGVGTLVDPRLIRGSGEPPQGDGAPTAS